jgi:hypothetical protein
VAGIHLWQNREGVMGKLVMRLASIALLAFCTPVSAEVTARPHLPRYEAVVCSTASSAERWAREFEKNGNTVGLLALQWPTMHFPRNCMFTLFNVIEVIDLYHYDLPINTNGIVEFKGRRIFIMNNGDEWTDDVTLFYVRPKKSQRI